jgi:hypothetical protein
MRERIIRLCRMRECITAGQGRAVMIEPSFPSYFEMLQAQADVLGVDLRVAFSAAGLSHLHWVAARYEHCLSHTRACRVHAVLARYAQTGEALVSQGLHRSKDPKAGRVDAVAL